MTSAGQFRNSAYFDSVTLMRVAKELAALPSVADAAVGMEMESNQAILSAGGLLVLRFKQATDSDLLIAVKARTEKVALELRGICHDDVKGDYMGLCFAGQPESYGFRTARAKTKK